MPAKIVYQLKVMLSGSKPPIWRRILVPENINLFDLHEIIQRAMGWESYHLHLFEIDGQIYGDPEDDEYGSMGTKNELRYRLNQLGLREKAKFRYEYDFGDSWEHIILVEKILPADAGAHYPICLTGKRACPPEDVGGIWGYAHFLDVIADPDDEERDEMLDWIGGDFDPEEFDLDKVNAALKSIKPGRGRRKAQAEPEPEFDFDDRFSPTEADIEKVEASVKWVQGMNQEQIDVFESLPLRRDMQTFLNYLSENRTVGTQSTGNLPLKAVHEICAKFVKPPVLEEKVGEKVYKVRSEDDVWPLQFVHQLAFFARMVTGGPGQIWKVTDNGRMFPQLPSPIQVYLLFLAWYMEVDWRIAFPVSGLDNGLPANFKPATLLCLQELPLAENIPFEPFADRLIAKSGLTWPSIDQTNAHSTMRFVVKRLVIDVMETFRVLECEYIKDTSKGYELIQLKFIRLTVIGKGLLGLMK